MYAWRRTNGHRAGVLAALGCMACAGAQAAAIAPDLAAELAARAPHDEVAVIVSLSDKVDRRLFKLADRSKRNTLLVRALKEKAAATQGAHRVFLLNKGARRLRELWAINGIAATARASVIRQLASRPGIESIRLDSTLQAPVATFGSAAPPEWNLNVMKAPDLWSLGHSGAGVVVANMDTGVDAAHPDLAAQWRGGVNSWYDPHGEHATPHDSDGHGTQTMAIMVGGGAGGSAIGMAPDARWIAAKLYNDAGVASYSDIHLAFQWLLDPDGDLNTVDAPDVVNASWGLVGTAGQCITEFSADIEALKTAGIAMAFAAGNDGPAPLTSLSPANNPQGFSVGAIDAALAIASFSSRGQSACDGTVFPKLVAPGVNINTADLSFGGLPLYAVVSGTSYAAPHAAGAMALLAGAFPSAGVAQIEAALIQSAHDLGVAGEDNSYGHGLADVQAAYRVLLAGAGTGNAPSITSTAITTATQGQPYSYDVDASDPDAGNVLTYSLDVFPAGMTINGASGLISWTPAAAGANSVSVRVTDAGGLFATQAFTVTVQPAVAPALLYFSTAGNTAVPGVGGTADNADIYSWDGASFARVLDATAVGLPSGANVDGLKVAGGKFYLSFNNAGVAVPGVGTVQDEDIVVYDTGTLTWSLFFDGTAAGLNTDAEDVDAFDILADGSLIVSTSGNVAVPGLAGPTPTTSWADEDVLRCVPGSSAPIASCTWSVYFDGSDVALTAGTEDVDGVVAGAGKLYLSTLGAYGVTGLSNASTTDAGGDVFSCDSPVTGAVSSCASFTLYFRAGDHGLTGNLDAVSVP
jgi:bacillopeptidase F